MTTERQGEAGIVSIMVTLVTMLVISLIVLGFADITRSEQRSSLDSQLSSQAYYAAESGVNDARAVLETQAQSGNSLSDKTVCGNQGVYNFTSTIDASHNVSYSCVLINASPPTLSYTVGYTSTVVPILSNNNNSFGTLILTWTPESGRSSNLTSCYPNGGVVGDFITATKWSCNYPVLRVDLFDVGSGYTRAGWGAATYTYFFVPDNSGGAGNVTLKSYGAVVKAKCSNGSATCTSTITGVGGKKYYMRVTTLYRSSSLLTISSGGAKFSGAEAIIDSTGKAQDVLRRILVAVDLTDANTRKIPSAAIITQDSLCKRFGVTPNSFEVFDNSLNNGAGGNKLCQQQSSGTPSS